MCRYSVRSYSISVFFSVTGGYRRSLADSIEDGFRHYPVSKLLSRKLWWWPGVQASKVSNLYKLRACGIIGKGLRVDGVVDL